MFMVFSMFIFSAELLHSVAIPIFIESKLIHQSGPSLLGISCDHLDKCGECTCYHPAPSHDQAASKLRGGWGIPSNPIKSFYEKPTTKVTVNDEMQTDVLLSSGVDPCFSVYHF